MWSTPRTHHSLLFLFFVYFDPLFSSFLPPIKTVPWCCVPTGHEDVHQPRLLVVPPQRELFQRRAAEPLHKTRTFRPRPPPYRFCPPHDPRPNTNTSNATPPTGLTNGGTVTTYLRSAGGTTLRTWHNDMNPSTIQMTVQAGARPGTAQPLMVPPWGPQ